jgi:hypothetical protein
VNNTATAKATGTVAQLMRREMQPEVDKRHKLLLMAAINDGDSSDDDLDNANSRSILDFVVAFNLGFTLNRSNTPPGAADDYKVGDTVKTDVMTTINDAPELIRSVRIDLAVRAPFQDSSRAWSATNCANMRCIQVGAGQGAAPVRHMRTEVFVPNVAYEGY